MRFELAPYLQVGVRGETLIIGAGRCRVTTSDRSEKEALYGALRYFLTPRENDDIQHAISKNILSSYAYECLRKSSLLICSDDVCLSSRYSRNHLYFSMMGEMQPSLSQVQLGEKTVAIIGCGGIGNAIAMQLATSGVGKIILVDFDTVELSNLNRQFAFKERHVGQKKTETLAQELAERNSEIKIEIVELDLSHASSTELIPDATLWVLSADSPSELLFWINRSSVKRKVPYINVGYCADVAIWGPFVVPGATGCHECQSVYASTTAESSALSELFSRVNARHRPASSGPINQLASAMATRDILNYLIGVGEVHSLNNRIGIFTHNLEIQKQQFSRSASCIVCSHL